MPRAGLLVSVGRLSVLSRVCRVCGPGKDPRESCGVGVGHSCRRARGLRGPGTWWSLTRNPRPTGTPRPANCAGKGDLRRQRELCYTSQPDIPVRLSNPKCRPKTVGARLAGPGQTLCPRSEICRPAGDGISLTPYFTSLQGTCTSSEESAPAP